MVKPFANFRDAVQQTITNQQLDALAFTLLNAIPLVNRLEERQRLASGALVCHPLFPLLLPSPLKLPKPRRDRLRERCTALPALLAANETERASLCERAQSPFSATNVLVKVALFS